MLYSDKYSSKIKTRGHAMSPKPGHRTRFECFMNLRFRGQHFFYQIS